MMIVMIWILYYRNRHRQQRPNRPKKKPSERQETYKLSKKVKDNSEVREIKDERVSCERKKIEDEDKENEGKTRLFEW